ncbi:WD repeat- and FYVE domain-containing protein 4 isoform X1 [Syngnathus typhle]|uniref:WD repeat- and FYVE domain-containing protein 4 isoform X1 n=1 Tax=Syngnathus typhle TaxID=161592 RepID=UPI002A6A542B|nr:WD repeat- and FYVE domain-containing protein 4 isoform X1 [Syngnathus typhle]
MALTQTQDAGVKGDRVNKETGELSASGELSVSAELDVKKAVVPCRDPRVSDLLRDQLHQLDIYQFSNLDCKDDVALSEKNHDHLVRVLPLYIQVCEEGEGLEGVDLKGLAALTTDAFIHNIHNRLTERPAENAREEVVRFFQKEDEHTICSGWLLLKSLLLLTADSSVSSINPELPAVLVKCLYLLVCIPPKEDLTTKESFQEPLTQVLLQLCRQPVNVERLVETQELQCLIIGLTSLWDQTSVSWRHQASRVLKVVSAVATSNTVPNLLAKNSIRICIQNLLHINSEAAGPLLAEVAVAVFSFIPDTYLLNPALFIEFETHNGYKALQNILKRCEGSISEDQFHYVEELLALIASFTLLGKTELKVALCVSHPQPPGFKFVPPLNKGSSVKNMPAFYLLQATLLQSEDSLLCCQILRTVQMIWERDKANFFLLEWTTQTMAQVAACVCRKPPAVQTMFFSMLEMVIFKLNYIPHEALCILLAILKQSWSGSLAAQVVGAEFGVATLTSFHKMTVHSGMLAEVLSDGGLLELLLGELRRRAKIIRKAGIVSTSQLDAEQLPCVEDCDKLLTTCMLQVVSALTLRSIKNTVSVRELGMLPYIKLFLDEAHYRGPALCILEHLAELNPEEFMSTAIGALCSSTQQELALKRDLLQSMLNVLESPNSLDAFRRAGGFAGLLSLVLDMEGALADPPRGEVWRSVGHQPSLDLLLLALHILASAVHLHAVNGHFFQTGGFYEKLAEALLQLGCFNSERSRWEADEGCFIKTAEDHRPPGRSFYQFVELAEEAPSCHSLPSVKLSITLRTCIRLLSYLDHFATGLYSPLDLDFGPNLCDADRKKLNGTPVHEGMHSVSPPILVGPIQQSVEDLQGSCRTTGTSISNLESQSSRFTYDHVILHPGAIRVIMTLLPFIFTPEDIELSMEIQLAVANHIQSAVKSERNRQIMCEGGLLSTLLTHCHSMLLNPKDPLHQTVTRIFEKLSSQAITPLEFRKFLCLADPLMSLATKAGVPSKPDWPGTGEVADLNTKTDIITGCSSKPLKRTFSLLQSTDSKSFAGSAIPAHQIISLVSMTSPRNFRPHRLSATPAFVEFDMTESGYGCLFLPSLATVKGVTADSISTGGIGGDCRGFPPTAGLSYSCWFQINRFSSACDSQPIRLLTVVRHMSRTEQQYICLSVSFSAYDGCLVLSTEEEAFTYLDMMESEVSTPTSLPTSLRFRCSSLLVPGQWHHLVVVMAKDVKKSCMASAYFNGKVVGTGKMKYIQPFPGKCVSMDPTAVIDVYALIGTHAFWKDHAALVWRIGPSYLFEKALSPELAGIIYSQGTAYLGNFLALCNKDPEVESSPLWIVPEERITFGINPSVSTLTNVVRIRENYNEVDCRLIAKELGITSRDQSTPVFLAHNISQHLSGTARTIGAALIGHFGVRTFVPRSAADAFLYVGGPSVVLSLIAMAADDTSLYAAVKVLLSVLETNSAMQQEMNRICGYKLLAFLLKMKKTLVSHRTFQLILYLSSSMELSCGSDYLQNPAAFQALLLDLEVWKNTSENLDLSVLNHFAEILKSPSKESRIAVVMHKMGVVPYLLFELCHPSVTCQKVKLVACVITCLLKAHFTPLDISRIGLFLIYTLPPLHNEVENHGTPDCDLSQETKIQNSAPASLIWIRNQLLLVLCDILGSDSPLIKDQQNAVYDVLGSDWFLFFLKPQLHASTVKLGLILLTRFLSCPTQQSSFREAVVVGSLFDGMEQPFALIDNLRAHAWSYECSSAACPGFDILRGLLVRHFQLPQVYEALGALLLGRRVSHSTDREVNLDDSFQSLIDSQADSPAPKLCVEAATLLLELVKIVIKQHQPGTDASWKLQLLSSVMQFFCLLHNLRPRDPLWVSIEFLHALVTVMFPWFGAEGDHETRITKCEDELMMQSPSKPVCNFMRILLMDSLLNVSCNSNTHPLVFLVEFCPDGASLEQRQSFQTELLKFMMDIIYMLGNDKENYTHLISRGSKGQGLADQMCTLMGNVVLFSKVLVQALYNGTFLGASENLVNFLTDQIVVGLERGQTHKEKTVSALYSCTNKAVLYFLSQPRHSRAQLEGMVKTFQTINNRWDVLLATYNSNVNFITCLLHCLLLIGSGSYPEGFMCGSQKVSGNLYPTKTQHEVDIESGAEYSTDDKELVSLAKACWSKVMTERRHTLEAAYKIEISVNHTAQKAPVNMKDISPLWEEIAHKAWLLHSEYHKQAMASNPLKKFDIISSAVRSAMGKQDKETVTVEEFLSHMQSHQQRGNSMFENMRTNHLQLRASEWDQLNSQWLFVEGELLRERAVFGPSPGVLLNRDWVQDAAEGPNRTRLRIRRKELRRSRRVLGALSLGSRKVASAESNSRPEPDTEPKSLSEIGTEAQEEHEDRGQDCNQLTFFPVLNETPSASKDGVDRFTSEPCSHTQTCADIRIILQELHHGEEVIAKMCVVMVSGLQVTEGVLLFTKESLLLCEGFTLTPSGDVCCTKHHPSSVRDSFISSMLSKESRSSCRNWLYEDIKEARFMRFLLEDNAIEVFMKNGHSAFLVFINKDHVSAYQRLCKVVSSLKGRGVADIIANARKTPVVEKTTLVKWQKGEISNFEYLMHLNTLGGRTYNDLMQYPVFPWVLADYKSETLDLSDPATFRDLSKPMGAQTEKRKQMFIQRYEEAEHSEGEGGLSARCHYCTHYSSAIIVASFLVRMEPFSHTFQTLQGGFDIPERMFFSVNKEWESASRDNMSDVRELIPEFYYLPDFLLNSNHMQLGCMADGTALGDVELPAWAKDDPQEFIRIQREALESDYVSAHLHLWIDLIFGYRQQGPAAVESVNTFHPYFYAQRGRQDAKDPLIRSTIFGYVSNFGQIPKQLFTKPHPKKEVPSPSHPIPFFITLDKLKTTAQPFRELARGPVGQIVCLGKEVVILERNRLLLSPSLSWSFNWGFPDNSCTFGNYTTGKTFAVCESLCAWGATTCAVRPNPTTVITAGSSTVVCVWDVLINKDKVSHLKLRRPLYGHTDVVTCMTASEVHNLVVSGSGDLTCILWDLEELSYITQLVGHTSSIYAVAINDLTGEIASCAGPMLYLWTMKGQLLACTDTSCGPRADIHCVSFTQRHEWDARNVVVTGCGDGIIRIWRSEYTRTQLTGPPEELVSPGRDPTALAESAASNSQEVKRWKRRLVLCRELNRSQAASQHRSKTNPAITALAVSRSHATLLAGDAWGRVFTWTCQ